MTTPRVTVPVEDLLFYKLKDLILEQSEGEWTDEMIERDAHHFSNHIRPLLSAAPAPEGGAVSERLAEIATWTDEEWETVFAHRPDLRDRMRAALATREEVPDWTARTEAAWAENNREETPAEAGISVEDVARLINPRLWKKVDEARPKADDHWAYAESAREWERKATRQSLTRARDVMFALRAQPQAREDAQPVAWRPVVGFEGHYEVSALGDVRNVKTGRAQAKNTMGRGYIKAEFWRDGERTQTSVHRVVAEAFLPRRDGLNEVNHIDGDKTNNAAWNLEWTDRKGNTDHSRYALGNDVKPVLATDPETGAQEYFPSIEEAGRSGYNASGIYDALNGRKRTHGGKAWSFTEWRRPQPTHPSPDALRVAVEKLETAKITDDPAEVFMLAMEALAALQAEQGAK